MYQTLIRFKKSCLSFIKKFLILVPINVSSNLEDMRKTEKIISSQQGEENKQLSEEKTDNAEKNLPLGKIET